MTKPTHTGIPSTDGACAEPVSPPKPAEDAAKLASPKPFVDDGDLLLYHGDAIEVLESLPSGIAQTCVTSPPYWGLRDYGTGLSQIGLEETPEDYVSNIVLVFREVRRVLRDDGTLWLNLGDSYISGQGGRQSGVGELPPTSRFDRPDPKPRPDLPNAPAGWAERAVTRRTYPGADSGYKPKDLAGMPWRVAFALQADGWYLRSDIIWSKPNPMPESVTDRPTKAHEYLFLCSKQPRYYWDADAIREPAQPWSSTDGFSADGQARRGAAVGHRNGQGAHPAELQSGRNRRSVWTIPTEPFPEAHFATYPQELVRPCILAGTSERGGCGVCGAPWRRQTDGATYYEGDDGVRTRKTNMVGNGHGGSGRGPNDNLGQYIQSTIGWEPSCSCRSEKEMGHEARPRLQPRHDPLQRTNPPPDAGYPTPMEDEDLRLVGDALTRPQLVLDPFIGSGTTALVARKHGRRCIGIDLSAEYLAIAAKRTQQLSLLGGAA